MSRPILFAPQNSSLGGSRDGNNYLVQFRAGRMEMRGNMVHPITTKGLVYLTQSADDGLMHFCWKERETNKVVDDLILFPDDAEFKRVPQCTTGRVYLLKIKTSARKLFYWMQEPKEEKDEELCKKVNDMLNNPPPPSAAGRGGGADGALGDLGSALSDPELANILNGMSPQQLLQMLGGGGGGSLAQLLGPPGGSSARSSSNSGGATASSARTPSQSGTASAAAATPTPSPASGASASVTPAAPSSTPSGQGNAAASQAAIQLSDLQNIIAGLQVPAQGGADAQRSRGEVPIDLSSSLTAEVLRPLLSNDEFMKQVKDHLPKTDEGQATSEQQPVTDQTRQEFSATVGSPQFQQALSTFSLAFQSGQLGPLISQFGLPEPCVAAANDGDMERFVRALQDSQDKNKGGPSSSSTEKEGDKKPKKDDDDMALD